MKHLDFEANTYDACFGEMSDEPSPERLAAVLKGMRPGSHFVALCQENVHRISGALEDAGFEIRDMISCLGEHGSEVAILAMRPLEGTFVENAVTQGVAGLDIERSRLEVPEASDIVGYTGRFPTNTVFIHAQGCSEACVSHCPVAVLDVMTKDWVHGAGKERDGLDADMTPYNASSYNIGINKAVFRFGDSGSAVRFFPKFRSRQALIDYLTGLILPPERESPRRIALLSEPTKEVLQGIASRPWEEIHV